MRGSYDLVRLGSARFLQLVTKVLEAELGIERDITWTSHGWTTSRSTRAAFAQPLRFEGSGVSWGAETRVQVAFATPEASGDDSEITWLRTRMRDDLNDLRHSEGKPQQVLYITNVTLDGPGDYTYELLREGTLKAGLRDSVLWSADEIGELLDRHHRVRHEVIGYVTADLLQSVFDKLAAQDQETANALSTHLATILKSERYADVHQAGAADDLKVRLAEVFVDVPSVAPGEPEESKQVRTCAALIKGLDEQAVPGDGPAHSGRYVVIGGPGQGKSTIGRFLCQIYRSELLDRHPYHRDRPPLREEIAQVRTICAEEGIDRPVNLRFPVFVPLTKFADALSSDPRVTLLKFLAARMGDVDHQMLRRWLRTYPWLVILDGLDEVPASANRGAALIAVDEFIDAAVSAGTDLAIVATSRQQGYEGEFLDYQQLNLLPLTLEQARKYAYRLINIRHEPGSERAQTVTKRLDRASNEAEIKRLMTNPLQVTILVILLAKHGRPPGLRFSLFESFYDIIYARELEKDTPLAGVLASHRAHVNALHARVGLILQTRAQRSGNTTSRISRDGVREVLRELLIEEGWGGDDLDRLVESLMRAATDRLVFLIAVTDEQFEFELRSLQEYCAALGLTSGSSSDVAGNLAEVACSEHWFNTVLFAFGRIFSDATTDRDMVVKLCLDLNHDDVRGLSGTGAPLMGSRLALDIILEGMADTAPTYVRSLARLAVRLVELADDLPLEDLVRLRGHKEAGPILEEKIRALHRDERLVARLGLVVLTAYESRKRAGAKGWLETIWHSSDAEQRSMLLSLALRTQDEVLLDLSGEHLKTLDPVQAMALIGRTQRFVSSAHSLPLQALFWSSESPVRIHDADEDKSEIPWGRLARMESARGWGFLASAARFARNPSQRTWEDAVAAIEATRAAFVDAWSSWLPWPLALWWETSRSRALTVEADTIEAWRKAQRRWVHVRDFPVRTVARFRGNQPVGVPRNGWIYRGQHTQVAVSSAERVAAAPPSRFRADAAATLLIALGLDGNAWQLRPQLACELAKAASYVPLRWLGPVIDDPEWADAIEEIGRLPRLEVSELSARSHHRLVGRWLSMPASTGFARLALHTLRPSSALTWDQLPDLPPAHRPMGELLAVWNASWALDQAAKAAQIVVQESHRAIVPITHWKMLDSQEHRAALAARLSQILRFTDWWESAEYASISGSFHAIRRNPRLAMPYLLAHANEGADT